MEPLQPNRPSAPRRGAEAIRLLTEAFRHAGWRAREPAADSGKPGADLILERGKQRYVVELKVAAEGRSDRLIPLWSQAYLQALRATAGRRAPLVVVAAPHVNWRAAEQILAFAAEHAPDAAAGVIDFEGLRRFRGPHLEGLDADHDRPSRAVDEPVADLFSDLNQWMLKVLLAPELPPGLLAAPTERPRDASQLARSAGVSAMSASRFVRLLKQEGHLDDNASSLQLVRREELFRRWQFASDRPASEVRMRFRLGGAPQEVLRRVMKLGDACLALFSAADALGMGFVRGVPPYLYVRRLKEMRPADWKGLVPAEQGEAYHVIVRQPRAVESVFRGRVRVGDDWASDIIQVWLDVSSHPTRGEEQAERIYRKVLAPIIEGRRGRR
jgi:Holliday junction resolvase